jgi:hypothetical protein
MRVEFTDAALRYAELGWAVLPIAPGWKLPAIPKFEGGNGVYDATTDSALIRARGLKYPNANLGIACGEKSWIVVLDVDPRNGGDASIRALAAGGKTFPKSPRARTGNGGWHLVFQWVAGIGNSNGRLGRGVDVKSSGGYFIAAPSWTRSSKDGPGGLYRWEVSPFELAPPAMPGWMLEILRPRPPRHSFEDRLHAGSLEGPLRFAATATKGYRNNALHWAGHRANELVADGALSVSAARGRLYAARPRFRASGQGGAGDDRQRP